MIKFSNIVQGRKAATLLSTAFLILSLVLLAISSSLTLLYIYQEQRQFAATRQQLIARDAANTVANFVEKKFSELEAVVGLGIRISASPEEQQASLNSLLVLDPAFRHVALLDPQGQEIAWASRLSQLTAGRLTDRTSSDMLAQVRQGNRQISPVHIDDESSEPLIVMAVPVTTLLGDLQGILLAEVNLKFMWELVSRLEVGETGVAYVVDRQGNLLAFGNTSRVLRGENVKHLNPVNEFVNNPAVTETFAGISKGISGVNAIGAYAPLGTPEWAVVTELPVREAYRPVFQIGVLALIGNLVMAIMASLIGSFAASRLAKPILILAQSATRIAAGEMDLQVTEVGPAEMIALAKAFNSMTTQLRQVIGGLQARTRALETSTRVSSRLSTILDREQLVAEVVKQVQDAFDYYYTQIYIIDEVTQDLVMTGGTGPAGQIMLAAGHRIPWGTGLTGRAATTNTVVLISDVSREEGWLPNPLLPDTRAEVVVPISIGERVMGVLDVQHNVVGGLDTADATMLQSIANQMAIAMQNANLFTETQQRAKHEALINIINQQIQSTATVENALQVAVTELGRALGTQRTSVQLASTSGTERN